MYQILIRLFSFLLVITLAVFKCKDNLVVENLALRQQLSAYHTKKKKPRLVNIAFLSMGLQSSVILSFNYNVLWT